MARYQVILAYDGTGFLGFQRQAPPSGQPRVRTVQSVVEQALRQIGWQGRSILSAGRTDTGVHASGQVIAFDLEWGHSTDDLWAALNANLPPDVAVQALRPVKPDFHPRFDALARRYRYRVLPREIRHPLRERYAWRIWPAADPVLMEQAAVHLLGTHDFAAFGTPPRTGSSTIRTVSQAGWQVEDVYLVFEIIANAFLYHMVRRLVYVLVAIGQGRLATGSLLSDLQHPPRVVKQGLAPAQGLTLVEVLYPSEAW